MTDPPDYTPPDNAAATPAVSVIIPCYTAVHFVTEALKSVFAQTYEDFEVIVVNDGSPEAGQLRALLKPWHDRLRVLNRENRGPAAARNAGISAAGGAFIAFLDSDDAWLPDFLQKSIAAFDVDPDLDMVYSDSVIFGNTTRSGRTSRKPGDANLPTFENLVQRRCSVHPSCVVARRRSLIRAGRFDEAMTFSEDLDLWARLVHGGGRIGYVPHVLTRRRLHYQSLTYDEARLIDGQAGMCRKLLRTLPDLTPSQTRALEQSILQCEARLRLVHGTELLVSRHYPEAMRELISANEELSDWRLRFAIAGMHIAPSLVRRLTLAFLARHPTGERLYGLLRHPEQISGHPVV
jgi:hypothetical protein